MAEGLPRPNTEQEQSRGTQQATRGEQEKWEGERERERETRPRGSQGQITGPPSPMGATGGF